MSIAENIATIRQRIATEAEAWQRDPKEIQLIAVSKTHPMDAVREAIAAGQQVFGENRVQEAIAKFPALRADHAIELHLIGPLQTNKVKEAIAHFDVIQTLDRPKLAEAIKAECEKQQRWPKLYVQVNIGEEDQKAGILPNAADDFIHRCLTELGLPVIGLMCIPPVDKNPAPYFALLREIARRHQLTKLSMGMSSDYDIAIRFGATAVRVGTAIFGAR